MVAGTTLGELCVWPVALFGALFCKCSLVSLVVHSVCFVGTYVSYLVILQESVLLCLCVCCGWWRARWVCRDFFFKMCMMSGQVCSKQDCRLHAEHGAEPCP